MKMKCYLTYNDAVSLLPNDEDIHTFRNAAFGLVGADWSRKDIINKLKETDIVIELTGEQAKSMGHGICAYSKNAKYQSDILFIETDAEKLAAFEKDNAKEEAERAAMGERSE